MIEPSKRWHRPLIVLIIALLAGNFCTQGANLAVRQDGRWDLPGRLKAPRKVQMVGPRARPTLIATGPKRPHWPQTENPASMMPATGPPESYKSRGGCSVADGSQLPTEPAPPATQAGSTPLYWNAWSQIPVEAKNASEAAQPVATMQVGIEHALSIDLSAIDYGTFFPSTTLGSAAVSTEVIQMFTKPKAYLNFEIAIFPDPLFYTRPPGSSWSADMPVETAQLSQYVAPIMRPPSFAAAAKQPFLFGRVTFRLKPSRAAAVAPIAVAVWVDGVPVDSFVIEQCISTDGRAESCRLSPMTVRRAANAAATASLGKEPPDAALQILSLGAARMGGVFRLRGETLDAAAKWYLPGPDTLRQKLSATLTSLGTAATANMPGLGESLVRILFAQNEIGAKEAKKRFVSFAVEAIKASKANRQRKHFVARMPLSTLVPLSLAAVQISSKEPAELLGNHLEIELPMEQPWTDRYADPATACNVRWLSVLPPPPNATEKISDGTMVAARKRLERFSESSLVKLWTDERPDETFRSFRKFSQWIGVEVEDDIPPASEPRSALVVLSHHDQNRLFFDDDDALPYTAISRRFVAPSFAILDACGTGNPAASQIVDSLNAAGFATLVATAVEVKEGIAADFLGAFAEALTQAQGPVRSGKVYARALEILMKKLDDSLEGDKQAYGPRAHVFMLLGDPDLPICNPQPPDRGNPP